MTCELLSDAFQLKTTLEPMLRYQHWCSLSKYALRALIRVVWPTFVFATWPALWQNRFDHFGSSFCLSVSVIIVIIQLSLQHCLPVRTCELLSACIPAQNHSRANVAIPALMSFVQVCIARIDSRCLTNVRLCDLARLVVVSVAVYVLSVGSSDTRLVSPSPVVHDWLRSYYVCSAGNFVYCQFFAAQRLLSSFSSALYWFLCLLPSYQSDFASRMFACSHGFASSR